MKQKLVYGAVLCAAIVTGVFYACKKENEGVPKITPSGAVSIPAARFEGTNTFYSKNHGDTVYKMVMIRDAAANNVLVSRSIYETNRPDTFKTVHFIEPYFTGIPAETDATRYDSIVVPPPTSGKKYFLIPFKTGSDTICLRPTPGENGLIYDCYTNFCPANSYCFLAPWDRGYFCASTDCGNCWTSIKLPPNFPGKMVPDGGSVLIEATRLNVSN